MGEWSGVRSAIVDADASGLPGSGMLPASGAATADTGDTGERTSENYAYIKWQLQVQAVHAHNAAVHVEVAQGLCTSWALDPLGPQPLNK